MHCKRWSQIRKAYTLYIIKLIRQTNTNRNNFYTLFEDGSDNKQ